MLIHKGCGGEIICRSCQWDDMFNACTECDQHEYCDGFEMIEINEKEIELLKRYEQYKNYFVTVQRYGGEISHEFTLVEIIRLSKLIDSEDL